MAKAEGYTNILTAIHAAPDKPGFMGAKPMVIKVVADKTTGTSFWDLVEDDRDVERSWETEWRQMVLARCMEQVRKEFDTKVLEAFELYAIKGMPVEQVAERLGMSRNAVYIAKSRVLSRLRQLTQEFE